MWYRAPFPLSIFHRFSRCITRELCRMWSSWDSTDIHMPIPYYKPFSHLCRPFSLTFLIISPTVCSPFSLGPQIYLQIPTERCPSSQREEPGPDSLLTKQQILEQSPGWPTSSTFAFITFCFIAEVVFLMMKYFIETDNNTHHTL